MPSSAQTDAAQPPYAKRAWRRIRKKLSGSSQLANVLTSLLALYLRLVKSTNRSLRDDSAKVDVMLAEDGPLIVTCWHGQHFMFPLLTRNGEPSAMMVSRSRDAELNAKLVEKLGITAIRGSGGRERDRTHEKGGARALIAMRNHLKTGGSVGFIADIPKGTPREAGLGIVTLARISGQPILPVAYATSRRHVFEKAWDKAALHLPFGRSAAICGELIRVAPDADEAAMEAARLQLQTSLNAITDEAYALVDRKSAESDK